MTTLITAAKETTILSDLCSNFTKRPHIGGGEQNKKLGEYIYNTWKSYKFDHVEMVQYDVLLSMPPRDNPNVVTIVNTTNNTVLWTVKGPEKVIFMLCYTSPRKLKQTGYEMNAPGEVLRSQGLIVKKKHITVGKY